MESVAIPYLNPLVLSTGHGPLLTSVPNSHDSSSVRSVSWKRIENFAFGRSYPWSCTGTFANQKLYLHRRRMENSSWEWFVVSLDINTELYERVEMPNGVDECDLSIGRLDGCLSVLDSDWPQGDLWVLKEHGLNQSWTKVVSIPLKFDPDNHKELIPLYMLNNEEILLLYGTCFAVYNPKDRSLRYPVINNFDACDLANIYVESLVSPTAYDGQGGSTSYQ